jgi:hypothetical protein
LQGRKSSNIWGKNLTNQNYIWEEIYSILKSGNACFIGAECFVFRFAIQKFKD